MRINQESVLAFARWSGDCNPIHVDADAARSSAFGGTIVHGALSTIEALKEAGQSLTSRPTVEVLEIAFRGEVRPGRDYQIETESQANGLSIRIRDGVHAQLSAMIEAAAPTSAQAPRPSVDWLQAALSGGVQSSSDHRPENWRPESFRAGQQVLGVHRFGPHGSSPDSLLTSTQEQVLGLCSFIVGMKAPGLSSLFTRLRVQFVPISNASSSSARAQTSVPQTTDALAYRLTFVDYDPHFRLLETELEIAALDGQPIAKASLQSYVRFPREIPDPKSYLGRLAPETRTLQGKVALVCGASRGLGAELAAALGAARCHVYLVSRHPDEQTQALAEAIRQAGGTARIQAGDVSDATWCQKASDEMSTTHGGLDVLILNACTPPHLTPLSATSSEQSAAYIGKNIALTQTPLIHFLPLVAAAGGTVVAISSSAVDEMPVGFGDYVAVKMAMEGAVKTAARENAATRFIIARPPKLRTSWSDSPLRAMGAIPPAAVAARVVDALAQPDAHSNLQLLTSFPYEEPPADVAPRQPDLKLALCASFTLDPIGEGVERWSQELDIFIEAELAPYAQVLQQLLNPASSLSLCTSGSVVLLRPSDWLRELSEQRRGDSAEVEKWLRSTAEEHVQALKTHRSFAQGPTLLLLCPSTLGDGLTAALADELERSMTFALANVPGLTVLNAKNYHRLYEVPEDSIHDALREELAHIPYQTAYYHFLVTLMVRFYHRSLTTPKKVVVLDCDNTLWNGVVGEVGAEGIVFEAAHQRLHRRLSELADSGVLLCLCSKNEQHDIEAVFEKRPDFSLRPEQFVASVINWLPKGENIRSLADKLNLGLDSFIFLDDNPVECAEVRSACPSVLTIQWPHDPQAAARLLDHLWEFDIHSATSEDRKRTRMYREEFQRQEIQQQAASFQEFIDSLQLNVQLLPLSEDDLVRAAQLTLRTNQFNFTTIRRTEAELRTLMQDPRYECRTVSVSDRFGDYGLVGFFIAHADQERLNVDTFLLSCRVLGRGVEHRMAAELGRIAERRGLSQVRWQHVPTERNAPARMFLSQIAAGALPVDPQLACEFLAAASSLIDLRFEAAPAEANTAESPKSKSGEVDAAQSTRDRERQLERISARLSNYAQLSQAFGDTAMGTAGDQASASNQALTSQVAEDIAETVTALFAKSLRLPAAEVTRIDRLDAMGCDSLQIVGITVALTKQFPRLPKTLLFEHRSVSEIIAQISSLVRGPVDKPSVHAHSQSIPARAAAGNTEIAIVGIGVNCAGGHSPEELWEFLSQGRSGVKRVPTACDSFIGQLLDSRPHFAGLLEGVGEFDPEFFGISPREAEFMDPQLRLLLQTAWHALEDAGAQGDAFDPSTGIFVGAMYAAYGRFANAIASQNGSAYRCWETFSLPNRLSQVLGCHGPSLSVDTACSSSATALHYACHSLRAGDCTSAIVSGVNLIIDPERLVQFGRLGILSTSGRCVPFGEGADGTVLGEGVVSIVLRPLDEARRRGDRIYAVIKGTGLSLGAGSVGFTAPNPNAQSQAARNAILAADIDPRSVGYIETHGTGTELGDPIEVRGLELAYCDRSLWRSEWQLEQTCTIGSIKPNIGHLEAGAGLSGVVKAALQLYHRTLLPSLTSQAPNPQIHFDQLPFDVQRSLTAWQPVKAFNAGTAVTLPRRAGVNSFGVGGSNVHIILEENPDSPVTQAAEQDRSAHVLTLSAASPSALQLQATAWQRFLSNSAPEQIADACYSANVGRKHHPIRAAVVVSPGAAAGDELARIAGDSAGQELLSADGAALLDLAAPPTLKTAFLFTGQGAQYPGMLRQLHEQSPVFRGAFDQCARYLDSLLPRALDTVVFSGDLDDRQHPIHQTGYTQPALFAIQYALFQLWKSWGIVADCLMGHSIGEVAAYCVAGGCSPEDALQLVAARGRLMQALPGGGGMCSIPLDRDSVTRAIAEMGVSVSIAAVNGPHQTVISGPGVAVAQIAERLEAQHGIKTARLSVSHAFHSALMEPMLEEFANVLSRLDLAAPQMPIVSSATGKLAGDAMSRPEYWLQQARNAVLFTDAMTSLGEQKITHYVELGPHPVMLAMGRQCVADSKVQWLPSARRGQDDWPVILGSLGKLYAAGAEVNWRGFDAPYARRRIAVPGYQFDTRRIWLEELQSEQSGPSHSLGSTSSQASAGSDTRGARAYQLDWVEAARPSDNRNTAAADGQESSSAVASGKWLIVSDCPPAASALADGLAARSIACVQAAMAYASDSQPASTNGQADRAVPAENGQASTGDLVKVSSLADLETLLSRSTPFARIIYVDGPLSKAPDDAQTIYERAVNKVFAFSQLTSAVSRCQPSAARCLWTITTAAVAADHEGSLTMSSAPLWGYARVAALECDGLWGGIVDSDDVVAQAERIIDELLLPSDDDQIVLRQSRRLVPRLKRRQPESDPSKRGLGQAFDLSSGAILITGGLGGIGIHLANWLAEQGATRLVLSSRTGRPSADASAAIESLQSRGVEVTVIAADVSTAQGIETCFDELGHTPLIGVIHAAGVDLKLPIGGTSRQQVEQLLAAKVRGAWRLHEACQGLDVQMFVCISSMAAILGSSDRSLYAAANAFLDALAHYRRDNGLPALSINFGPWTGGGMADAESLAQLEKIGNRGLIPGQTLQVIEELLREQATQAMVADIDWQRFRPVFESRRPKPILGELGRETKSSVAAQARSAAGASGAWLEELRSLPEAERPGQLMKLVQGEIAKTLRLANARGISLDRSLYQMGLDSITAVEFSLKLQRHTGVPTSSLLVGNPTIRRVSETLLQLLGDALSRPAAAAQAVPADQSGTAMASPEAEAAELTGRRSEPAGMPSSTGSDIVGTGDAMGAEVLEFCKQAWPNRDPDLIAPRWEWMYLQSAKRLHVAPRVWLFRDNDRITGHMGAQFFRLKAGKEEMTTAWLVDTMVLESQRDQGIGARLLLQAQEDMPFSLSLGQTAQARAILKTMGWKYIAPLQTYVLPLNANRVLQDKLPSPVVPAVSTLLQLRGSTRRLLTTRSAGSAVAHRLERFSARHDALWRDVSPCYGCATVRDASYLNWKYVDQPGQEYIRLEVTRGDELIGCVVLSIAEANRIYQHRRAHIVDLVTSTDKGHLYPTIRTAMGYCQDLGVDAIVMHLISHPIERALKNFGFLRRSPTRHLMIAGSEFDKAELFEPNQWLITQGDSDIDRP